MQKTLHLEPYEVCLDRILFIYLCEPIYCCSSLAQKGADRLIIPRNFVPNFEIERDMTHCRLR